VDLDSNFSGIWFFCADHEVGDKFWPFHAIGFGRISAQPFWDFNSFVQTPEWTNHLLPLRFQDEKKEPEQQHPHGAMLWPALLFGRW